MHSHWRRDGILHHETAQKIRVVLGQCTNSTVCVRQHWVVAMIQRLVLCAIHTAGCESAPQNPVCLQEGAAMRHSSKCPAPGTCRNTCSRTRSSSLRRLAAGDQGTHILRQHPKLRWLAWEG